MVLTVVEAHRTLMAMSEQRELFRDQTALEKGSINSQRRCAHRS
jgi:hypothetical protein